MKKLFTLLIAAILFLGAQAQTYWCGAQINLFDSVYNTGDLYYGNDTIVTIITMDNQAYQSGINISFWMMTNTVNGIVWKDSVGFTFTPTSGHIVYKWPPPYIDGEYGVQVLLPAYGCGYPMSGVVVLATDTASSTGIIPVTPTEKTISINYYNLLGQSVPFQKGEILIEEKKYSNLPSVYRKIMMQ